jgi:hypothetical protein
MSAQIKDGGPAFPCEQHETQDNTWNQTFESGMTLRDYFAAKASDTDVEAARLAGEDPADPNVRCRARFRHADAMLRAREVQP